MSAADTELERSLGDARFAHATPEERRAFHDGRLDSVTHRRAAAHFAICRICRRALEIEAEDAATIAAGPVSEADLATFRAFVAADRASMAPPGRRSVKGGPPWKDAAALWAAAALAWTPRTLGPRPGLLAAVALAVVAGATAALLRPRATANTAPPPTVENRAVALLANRSVAVLPLASLSGDPSDEVLGLGLAEEITRALARAGVPVIRISPGAPPAPAINEREIAAEPGVGWLLTGTVQREGGKARITVTLSSKGRSVTWGDRAMPAEIADSVAADLRVTPAPPRGPARAETADEEAYDLYLQGRVAFDRRTAQTLGQAVDLFERAVARDPHYARAQASLAVALALLGTYVRGHEQGDRALAVARRAIALDPTIAESYTAMGYVSLHAGRNRDADVYFRQALARDSLTAATTWGWYGLLANRLGDFPEAHRRIARARRQEPLSRMARVWDAYVLIDERRYAEADSALAETLARDSTFTLAYLAQAEVWVFLHRESDAVRMLERHVRSAPTGASSDAEGLRVWAYARAGQSSRARELLASIRARNGGELPPTGTLATALDALGEREAAVALLQRAVEAHDPWLVPYSRGERYDGLRRDPRVAAMLAPIERM